MNRILLSAGILFAAVFSDLNAQTYCKVYGGAGSDYAYDVKATADSGFVIAGSTDSYGAGGLDCYVVKYNKSGNVQWNKTVGDFGNEIAWGIDVATNGDYVIGGETNSLGSGGGDFYVARLTSGGTLLWTRSIGGLGFDYAKEIAATTDNGCVLAGVTGSFGQASSDDVYIVKLDASGNVQWSKAIGDVNTDGGTGVMASSDGNIVVAGRCFPVVPGAAQIFAAKLDYSGNTIWSNYYKSHDGMDFFSASDIVESNGNYFISGYCDTSSGSNKNHFLTSITPAGTHNWTRIIGIAGNDNGYGMESSPDGGFIITGTFFGTTASSFTVKTNSLGMPVWNTRNNSSGNSYGYGVIRLYNGHYVSVGNIDSEGTLDVFIINHDSAGYSCCGISQALSSGLLVSTSGAFGLDSLDAIVDSGGVSATGGTSGILCQTNIGMETVSAGSGVTMYPNPVKGLLSISNLKGFDRVTVVNLLGQKIFEDTVTKEDITVNLSSLTPGIYFVNLRAKDKVITKKIQVE